MQSESIRRRLAWAVRLLATLAASASGYLLYVSLTTAPVAGCGWETFDCDSVLASHWAKWFGLPVAGGGLLVYLAVLGASLLIDRPSPRVAGAGWRLLEASTPLAAGGAIWFVGVQLFALDTFCLYCLATHLCGMMIAALVICWRITAASNAPPAAVGAVGITGTTNDLQVSQASGGAPPGLGFPTALAVFALVGLITGQLFGPKTTPPPTVVEANELIEVLSFDDSNPKEQPPPTASAGSAEAEPPIRSTQPERRKDGRRVVKLLKGNLSVDTYDHPVLGSPDAEHVFVELMDYACPHCREFHKLLDEALGAYEGRVAVVVMPAPGEVLCNPYVTKSKPKSRGACAIAKVSLAAALLAPEDFSRVHHWLLRGERLPEYTAALIEAQRHADRQKLSQTIRDDTGDLQARIERYVKLLASLQRYGRIGLPAQIYPDRVVAGPPETLSELYDLWSRELGVENPTSGAALPF